MIPSFEEIRDIVLDHSNSIDPDRLINILTEKASYDDVIEGLQQSIERGYITFDMDGMIESLK